MKKLTLNKITFAGATELTREQLKKVMGGGGYGTTMPGVETTEASLNCPAMTCGYWKGGANGYWVSGTCSETTGTIVGANGQMMNYQYCACSLGGTC